MEERTAALRAMQICRFCLTEKDPLSNIYERDNKNAIPLPLQIMACVAIEVFANDGMPQLICDDCRLQTVKSYAFKTMCKRSEDSLKLYLATGTLTKHEKEEILQNNPVQKRFSELEPLGPPPLKRMKPEEPPAENGSENPATLEIQTNQPESNVERVEEINSAENELEEEVEDLEYLEDEDNDSTRTPPKQVTTHCFPCSHCERSFPLQQLLDIHMRQHTRERKFACDDCGKKFFTKHDLIKHAHVHSGEKPFTCVVCDKSFSRATLLHRHEKIHISVPKYLCTYCDKTYLSSGDLDSHMLVHKKKRPYQCSRCDKRFAFKQGMERHEAVHNPENPYKCNYCDDSFTTPAKLARHVTSHAGARPYPCKLCPRTFLLSHHLTRHLRNHYNRRANEHESGEHKCDFCSMSFRRKDSLVNHTAIHSMVNLKCVICNKEFNDAQTVKLHVSTHLAGLPYPCDKCDYSFETQEELEDHEVKHVDFDEEEEDEYIVPEPLEEEKAPDESNTKTDTANLRRSQRESKVKNYADFLKDDLESDSEENVDEPEEEEPVNKVQIGTIQPVIRSETIKMYKGVRDKTPGDKATHNKLAKNTNDTENTPADLPPLPEMTPKPVDPTPKSVTKITTLENLGISKQTLDVMTEKSGFVEMKVGQNVVRVKKLMVTKAEYQAMAKQGKLEMKGSTIVVQNSGSGLALNKLEKLKSLKKGSYNDLNEGPKMSEQKVVLQQAVDIQVPKTPLRTYVKKAGTTTKAREEPLLESTTPSEVKDNACNIDLDVGENQNETAITETDILGKY